MLKTRMSLSKLVIILLSICSVDASDVNGSLEFKERECLTVELIMYSGRPRPQYYICDKELGNRILQAISEVSEDRHSVPEYPKMESSPAYQGILLQVPEKEGFDIRTLIIRRGFIRQMGSKEFSMDRNQNLERQLLELALNKVDESNSFARGRPLQDLAQSILDTLDAGQ